MSRGMPLCADSSCFREEVRSPCEKLKKVETVLLEKYKKEKERTEPKLPRLRPNSCVFESVRSSLAIRNRDLDQEKRHSAWLLSGGRTASERARPKLSNRLRVLIMLLLAPVP
jgi:hypothetical protein